MSSSPVVYHNATVYTADAAAPTAQAFAVRDGRFVAVGAADVPAVGPGVSHVDAGGRTVVPGFVDAHAHLHELGRALRRADLAGASSPDAVVARLRAYAAEHDRASGTWLRGHGWDQTDWTPPRFPSRTTLDAAFPERPVWLTRTDVHAGWANTAALEASVGLDRLRRMDDPPGGHIHRHDDGSPSGVLVDAAMSLVTDHIPPPSTAADDRALRVALTHTAAHGITTLHDAGVERPELRRFRRLVEADACPLRISAMVLGGTDTFDRFCRRGPYHHPSGRLDVASTKFFADGALGSRGAALLDDYADAPGERGLLRHDPPAFREAVRTAVEAGFQVNTHAIGDRAARRVLDAYAAVQTESPAPMRRPRIEHAQVVAPADRARFGALGVIASVQPDHAVSDARWVADRLGPDRLEAAYAWPALRAAGARLAFGSDAPVEPLGPLRAFHAAVTRQSTPDGQTLSPPLPRPVALRAHTRDAARAVGRADAVGTITPGKRADWVVLSHDPMRVPADALPDIDVVATYLDGRCVHAGPDWPDP
jgi:hypothetical protein